MDQIERGERVLTGQGLWRSSGGFIVSLPVKLLIGLLSAYRRFVSPLFPPHCRFYPSCSAYALEAIERHGLIVGGGLALRRLLRCHPFHPGGIDPVPDRTIGKVSMEEHRS